MQSDFILAVAPISTYKLVIIDRNTPSVLIQFFLTFHTDCEFYKSDGVKQFQEHLSDWLDELPKDKWNKKNIFNLVNELMTETPFSKSMSEINPVTPIDG